MPREKPTVLHQEFGSGVLHLLGILLSIAALVLLVTFSALYAGALQVTTVAIYGATLILLYTASTVYHFIPQNFRTKVIFQRLDHSMIYVLIAGTYTPITLVSLRGAWGWSMFGVSWGLAILGILLKWLWPTKGKWFHVVLYVLMGWLILIAAAPLYDSVTSAGLFWLGLGGAVYTLGVIFYALGGTYAKKNHFLQYRMHEIFHLFVLGGSFSHFWFMLRHLSS